MHDRFLSRLFWLTLAAAVLILLWRGMPDLEGWLADKTAPKPDASPRIVRRGYSWPNRPC